jgi:hypothetical protein
MYGGYHAYCRDKRLGLKPWYLSIRFLEEVGITHKPCLRNISGKVSFLNYAMILYIIICTPIKYRIQPLNGKISSVTQIVSEESKTGSPAPLHAVVEEPCVGSLQEPTDSKSTASSHEVTEGGVFAGIGHFPPTPKPDSQSSRCPPIHYKPDATLR